MKDISYGRRIRVKGNVNWLCRMMSLRSISSVVLFPIYPWLLVLVVVLQPMNLWLFYLQNNNSLLLFHATIYNSFLAIATSQVAFPSGSLRCLNRLGTWCQKIFMSLLGMTTVKGWGDCPTMGDRGSVNRIHNILVQVVEVVNTYSLIISIQDFVMMGELSSTSKRRS